MVTLSPTRRTCVALIRLLILCSASFRGINLPLKPGLLIDLLDNDILNFEILKTAEKDFHFLCFRLKGDSKYVVGVDYATRTGLLGQTRNSITQLQVLERELARVKQYGIARDNEELELGVRCMAAGIYDDQGKLVAGLSISAPADRLDEGWLPKLENTAKHISELLGYVK